MSISDELTSAIAAHATWKFRLKNAIDSGKIDVPIATIKADNACTFGKWLDAVPLAERSSKHYTLVKRLHAEFHKTAGEVASMATVGKASQAKALLQPGGTYSTVSADLTRAVTEWKNSVT